MDAEEATQPATQLIVDPRRLGMGGSGLNDEDLADICCILHPASLPAYRAAALIHENTPQYTISTDGDNIQIRERHNGKFEDCETFDLAAAGLRPCDIALRLSADLKDPLGGFHFGRNKQRCDFLIGRDEKSRRVSNIHFRIYINEYGVIMLEDQSTNGTAVDGTLLRGKEKENGHDYRHTLEQGSVIMVIMMPPEVDYRFYVRIPHRDEEAELAYQQNLTAYFLRLNNVKQENAARLAATNAGVEFKRDPVNLFPTTGTGTPNPSSLSSGRHIREWRGGTKYNKVGYIGKGAFAVVYKLTAKFDGVPYAAKELEKRRFMKNGVLDQKVDMEMKIMRSIKHPNIVQYIEHVDWEEYLYIIMEYVPGGDLGSLIGDKGPLPELDVKAMAGQLLSALKYLHEGGITHRDVKPDNILISSRDPFVVKLTDFGLSKMVDSEETFLRTFCGTLLYCAPEVYSEYREYDQTGKRNLRGLDKKSLPPQRYGHAVDVWSLAGVLFYALCGSPPYPVKNGTSYQELLNQIMTQPLDIRPLQRLNISENGIRFVRNMLHVRPEYRATIDELERRSWLCGGDSMDVSMEEDEEVDMIGGSFIDPELEEGTSQLSIQNGNDEGSQEEEMNDGVSDLTEVQQIEIPNSFSTSNSEGNESFGFMRGNGNPGNGRLFGEVNVSALGSSGAVPDELSLPIPAMNHRATLSDLSEDSRDTESDLGDAHLQIESSSRHPNPAASATMPNPMPPPPPPHIPNVAKQTEIDDQFTRSSSLLGAESMVGHLNVHSPSSAASPAADSPTSTTETGRDTTVSLRRPREEDVNEDGSWQPADLPAKRRRRSEREIDLPVPPSIFWDPKDKSTHHTNYPRMSHSDYLAYQEYAESKGELFRPGQKTFEMTMQSFRMSRSPSIEPEVTRAHSEPTKEEGKRMMMKRDERNLAEDSSGLDAATPNRDLPANDESLPSTAHPSKAPTIATDTGSVVPAYSQPVVGNDFQPPKRILAKVIATPDSCLPTITLNITDSLTSWGRGYDATVRYSNGSEIRIPKYAFKILLFKPNYYTAAPSSRNAQAWNDQDQDMRFYISTKASQGIYVNGIYVRADDHQHPTTLSRNWGELRHGDLITVWRNEPKPEEFTRFRFECYWGKSKEPRKEEEVFQLLEEGEFLTELEQACLKQEKYILTEQRQRDEEERKAMEKEREVEKAARKGGVQPTNCSQSSSGATSSTS